MTPQPKPPLWQRVLSPVCAALSNTISWIIGVNVGRVNKGK